MNERQEAEWNEAQKISIGEDLIAVAKKQLEFLAAVDHRVVVQLACSGASERYKAFWLPLLAKHTENGEMEGPLVVPLDCEWIWHCHRLNLVQYKLDCEKVFGRILDCKSVTSSVQLESKKQAEEVWARFHPDEPFELDYNKISSEKVTDVNAGAAGDITYDLVAAVQRQSSFYYQVSRPSVKDSCFLAEALRRYKGFLYLIKNNQQIKLNKWVCVPTYDIDIMWHSHQLCPVSYHNDMIALVGTVVQHDDTDSDRSIGKRLHDGFTETTKQFEETFGLRYWKAGAMHRGSEPTPLITVPVAFNQVLNCKAALKSGADFLSLPVVRVVQVFLEIVDVKNAPMNESETLYVYFTKNQPDMHFNGDGGTLSILSLTGEKEVAGFECEPAGDIALTLIAKSNSNPKSVVLGTTTISLDKLTGKNSNLLIEKWFKLKSDSTVPVSDPIYLRVAASSTVPKQTPLVLHMVRMEEKLFSSPFGNNQNVKCWTSFVDDCGKEIARVQMRSSYIIQEKKVVRKIELVGATASLKNPIVLAIGSDNKWLLNGGYNFCGAFELKATQDGTCLCELKGDHVIKMYLGKKLEYEEKCCRVHNEDSAFVTAVQFSNENPYGKAIALLDMKSKLIEVNKEWFVLPWITLSFILMDMLGREINTHASKNTKDMHTSSNIADGARCFHGDMRTSSNIADGARCFHGDMRTCSNIADGARCFHGDKHTGSNIDDSAKRVHVSAGAGAICYGDCYFKS